jgi:hypothetical protein
MAIVCFTLPSFCMDTNMIIGWHLYNQKSRLAGRFWQRFLSLTYMPGPFTIARWVPKQWLLATVGLRIFSRIRRVTEEQCFQSSNLQPSSAFLILNHNARTSSQSHTTIFRSIWTEKNRYIGFMDSAGELGEDTAASPQYVQEFLDRGLYNSIIWWI